MLSKHRAADHQMSLVLIADDDQNIRNLIKVWLEGEGHEAVLAEDGQAALESALKLCPAVVISDVMMPKLDGFELLRRLKEDEATSAIPILMLSARGQEEGVIRALEEGASDYVVKPFSPRELMARVNRLINGPTNRPVEPLLRKLGLIERFARAARKLIEIDDIDQLSEFVLSEALEATGAQRGSLMIAVGESLEVTVARGLPEDVWVGVKVPFGEGIAGRVAAEGRPLLVQDLEGSGLPPTPGRYEDGSLLSVPVRVHGRTLAVLNVNTKPEYDLFSAEDLEALEILADLAALSMARLEAVRNAKA